MCSHTQNNCPFSPQRDHSFFFKKNCSSLFVCFARGLKMPTAESSGGTGFRERIILQRPFLWPTIFFSSLLSIPPMVEGQTFWNSALQIAFFLDCISFVPILGFGWPYGLSSILLLHVYIYCILLLFIQTFTPFLDIC